MSKQTDDERIARKNILEVTYLSVAVLFALILIFEILFFADTVTLGIYAIVAEVLIGLTGLISFIFSRRGYLAVGEYLMPFGMLLVAYIILYYTGIESVNSLFFISILSIVSVTSGSRGVWLYTLITIASVIGIYYAQINGYLEIQSGVTSLSPIIPASIIAHILGNAFVLIFLIRVFNTNLFRAQENERLQIEANHDLRKLQITLEQRVADRTRALETSTDVSRRISTILDPQELVREVVDQVRNAFGYYHAQIYTYDGSGKYLIMVGGTSEAGQKLLEKGHKIEKGSGLVGQAAETNQIIFIPNVSETSGWLSNPALPDTKSELAVPISIGDEVLGVLDVQDDKVGGLTQTDADLIQSIANQVALAMQNSQSFQAAQTRATELKTVADVSTAASSVLDLNELLQTVVDLTKESFGFYFVSVFLYEPEAHMLVFEAGTGAAGQKMKTESTAFHIDATPSLIAQAGREQQPVVIQDVSQSSAHFYNPYLPDTSSEAVIPMIVKGELLGVLGVQSTESNVFNDATRQILATLAKQIGVAIQNARLFEEQLFMTEELRTLDKMKSQFLSSMSHELRTPLNAIINFVEMVSLGMVGSITEEQKELLDHSVNSSTHLLHVINDVLDISKIQAGRLTLFVEQDVDLYRELEAAIEMVVPMINQKPVQMIRDIDNNLPILAGDKRRIRQVLLNLLSNAIKFTEEGSVTVSAKHQGDHVMFAVIDTGPGIDLESQSVIFEPFVQTADGIKMEQGTGLGLSISLSLAQAHGGELWVESQPDQGAAFYFTLPIAEKS
ncbi:MAG: GAF domain-containing protein [Anaerolineales bacterium]|nr:GAF domain-containing protein [Chloroflexota bacterium]MBL6982415.1 GAF domain-containing protein [Anaerolineales bacterium]